MILLSLFYMGSVDKTRPPGEMNVQDANHEGGEAPAAARLEPVHHRMDMAAKFF